MIRRPDPGEQIKRAEAFARQGHDAAAVALLRKTIAAYPGHLAAHVAYVRIRTFHQESYDAVRREYDLLMSRDSANPVYPLALSFGAQGLVPAGVRRQWLERIVRLTPEGHWGHYAQALLIQGRDSETAARQLMLCIDEDGSDPEPYLSLIALLANKSGRLDDAIRTAEKMASRPEMRANGLYQVWNLRLTKAGQDQEMRAAVRRKLDDLADSSEDTEILTTVRNAYENLFAAHDRTEDVDRKLRRLDPGWYPESATVFLLQEKDGNGYPRQVAMCCRDVSVLFKAYFVPESLIPDDKMARLTELLSRKSGPAVKRYIYGRLLSAAELAQNQIRIIQYAEALHALDPQATIWLSKAALARTNARQNLVKALAYARLAERSSRRFVPAAKPPNSDADWFHAAVTPKFEQEAYKNRRALALDAYGWALCRIGHYADAERELRKSLEFSRSAGQLEHLAGALRGLGRLDEAEAMSEQAGQEHAQAIRAKMVRTPAPDFELSTVTGKKFRLSDFKGRVVLLYFMTTWCTSCSKEQPYLLKLAESRPKAAFDVLAVSMDQPSDQYRLAAQAREFGNRILVLRGENLNRLYDIPAPPGIVIVNQEGVIRYRHMGFYDDTAAEIEVVLNDLLDPASPAP